MTYNAQITKTEVPHFFELYDFITINWTLHLTPYHSDITYSNTTYIGCVMERTDFEIEKAEERSVTVSIATKENVSLAFLTTNVPRIRVRIRRYFPEADVIKTIFVGEGDIVGVSNRALTFKAVDILSLNKSKVPPFVYAPYCNNTLFDNRCGVLASQYRLKTSFIVSQDGQRLFSNVLKSYSADYFTYGYAEYHNNWRLITKHDNVDGYIYLHVPFDENIDGKEIVIFAGCDKTPQTCKNKFNNLSNFLGFPYIPLRNPVIWGII